MDNTQKSSQAKKLAGAAAIVMSSMIISRITGFLRSVLISNALTKVESDALLAAFRTSDIMYNMLVGGSIAAALIPILSGYIAKKQEKEGWKAVSSFINAIFLGMVVISMLGSVFAYQLVQLTAPGLKPDSFILAVKLTRILFPSVGFIILAGFMNGILNSYQRFAAAAYGPSVYNLGTVLSIWVLSRYGVDKVAVGIMCSAALYFFFQLSFAFRNMKYYRFFIEFRNPGFLKLFALAIPSLISSSIVQVNTLVSQVYNSHFESGSITAYTNATDTWQLPYGIFAMGLGTAILPTLSEKLALGELDSFKRIMNRGLKTVLLVTIPSAVGFIVLNDPIVSAIYKWSVHFDSSRILLVGNILSFFSIALLAQSMLALINRAFYADNDTRTPLYVALGSLALNAALGFIFYKATRLHTPGIALAYSVSSTFNAVVLLYILNKRMKGLNLDKLFVYVGKILFASALMALVIFLSRKLFPMDFTVTFHLKLKVLELIYLFADIALGSVVFAVAVLWMRLEEAIYIKDLLFGKLRPIWNKITGQIVK